MSENNKKLNIEILVSHDELDNLDSLIASYFINTKSIDELECYKSNAERIGQLEVEIDSSKEIKEFCRRVGLREAVGCASEYIEKLRKIQTKSKSRWSKITG